MKLLNKIIMTILKVTNLSKTYPIEGGLFRSRAGTVRALDNVSASLERGKVLGVVGESGSGKTTLGKLICRLIAPDSGGILIDGKDIGSYSRPELSRKVQLIFQDPFASLNPKLSVASILGEADNSGDKTQKTANIAEALRTVGLPESAVTSYPHQFSGGQRQRIAVARALLKAPEIIVADEPLSALDLTIQNQLLELFSELKEKKQMSFIFISHDLAVTSGLSDYLIVMQNGKIAEEGLTVDVINNPKTEYARRLLEAVPKL